MKQAFITLLGILCLMINCTNAPDILSNSDRIRPWPQNPRYWQFKGKPVLLLGIRYDNWLWVADPESLLTVLKDAGGNYIECSLFSAGTNKLNPWTSNNLSDSHDVRLNTLFWERLEALLRKSEKMNILVQLRMLPEQRSVASQGAINHHQMQMLTDTLLARTLQFGNILYRLNFNNAITPKESLFWIKYIKSRTVMQKRHISVSADPAHLHNFLSNPDSLQNQSLFSFSMNLQASGLSGQSHWNAIQSERNATMENPLPVTCSGSFSDPLAAFWRNMLGGMAAVLFEENPGIKFGSEALASLKSARMLQEKLDLFRSSPNRMDLLLNRNEDDAYMTCILNKQYALFFPREGSADLTLENMTGIFEYRWLDIKKSEWRNPMQIPGGGISRTITPAPGAWIALYRK